MEKKKGPMLYLLASFLAYPFIWVILDLPSLYHDRRRPFLLDADFVAPFLRHVGGPIDALASLVTQLYYYPWLGALTLFLILATLYAATTVILQAFGRPSRLASLLPAALGFFLLQAHITVFPLLSFVFSLCMAAVFIRCNVLPLLLRLAIFTALSALTCYVAGGTALLFALICALNGQIIQKQRRLLVAYLVLGALIPYAVGTALFEPNRTLQYFAGAPLEAASPDLHPLELTWYALLPLAIIGTAYTKKLRLPYLRALRLSCILGLALLGFVMVKNRFFRYTPMALDLYAENGEWGKALNYARRFSTQATVMTAHIVNHSLYHLGRLPHDMFDYPQFRNDRVLLLGMGDKEQEVFPRADNRRSDVYYWLGRIDQAERWAHEVLTNQGFHGPALRRLISINVLKNRPKAARMYAGVLQRTLTHRTLATDLIAQFERGALLASDPEINSIRPLLPKTDYVGEWTTRDLLNQQLSEMPTNRMAFEYLMAHLLITGNIMEFGQNVHRAEAFGHRELPRAYEEACLVYTLATGKTPPNLGLTVREDTRKRFERFMELIRKHHRDRRAGWEATQGDFGNTYWFFKLFGRSGSVGPPDFDTKQ